LTTVPSDEVEPGTATRVLLLGDDTFLEDAEARLKARGYATVRNGKLSAIESYLTNGDYAAAILSIGQGDGSLAFKTCRDCAAQRNRSVILLYSGRDPSFAVRALESGADDVLLAPANPSEVVARVGAAVRRRRLTARALRRRGEAGPADAPETAAGAP
jgi:DNA-binding response OmpR family regulator